MPRTVTLFALLLAAAVGLAQPSGARLRGEAESGRTRKRLTEAQQKLADGGPTAADELQRILDESGDDLVLVKDNQYQPARRLVQQSLAALPPKHLATFRDRLEEPAKKLLDAGKKARDPKPLRELVDRYFVSRPAEEALLLLGELAFERADFVAAERHWRTLLPGEADGELRYPQPKTDPATLKAKLLLALAMRGDRDGATAGLEQFKKDHPKAAGPLAGMNGVYADTLAKLIPTAAPPPPADPAGWTGFAGGPARDGRPPADLPRRWPSRPTWRAAIPFDKPAAPKPGSVPAAKTLAFHPVVMNGQAYIADAGRIYQFDLKTGASRLAFHAATFEFELADFTLPAGAEADFTLTVAGGKLFARFGPPALPTGNETGNPPARPARIVCLEPKADAAKLDKDEPTLTARWHAVPPVGKEVFAAWEGAPVVADGRVYAAYVRVENNRLAHAIACYPTAGGNPLWTAEVCESDPRPTARYRAEVLTLAGANVVYCTHTGVTVAVSAATGKPAWAFRTPPPDRPPPASPRDLCPPVYADGRVFVAPADGDGVYALDADSGRRLWSAAPGLQVENLLGVSRGRLVATTHSRWNATSNRNVPETGLRGFDVTTGSDLTPDGWRQHEAPDLGNYGRGIAGPNVILYPAKNKLWLIDPATGRVAYHSTVQTPGNLAAADGVVLVATATEVWEFVFDDIDSPAPSLPRGYPLVGAKDPPAFDPKAKVAAAPTAFDPQKAPGLTTPAGERKAVALPPRAVPLAPLVPSPDAPLVLCDGERLFARDADTGKQLWETKLDSPARFRQVAFTTDGRLVTLGEHAVAAADLNTGKPAWQFAVPAADPTPKLSHFQFAGNRLVAKLGPRGLIALDLETGKVAWVRAADGKSELWPLAIDGAATFGPHPGTVYDRVYVQRSDECLELDAGTGDQVRTFPTPIQEWTGPPTEYRERAVIPDASGGLRIVSPKASEVFPPSGREAGRTGAPPAARPFARGMLVVIPRNVGDEVRFPTGGSKLLPPGVDLPAAVADTDRVYLPAGNELVAFNVETWREEWRVTLPDLPAGTRWMVRAGRTTVIVHPAEAIPDDPPDVRRSLTGLLRRPSPLRLLGTAADLFDAATRFTLPVLLFEPDTGKLAERIDLPAVGPPAAVIPRPDGMLVATTGRAVWLGKK